MHAERIEGGTSTGAHVHGDHIASRGKDARRSYAAHMPYTGGTSAEAGARGYPGGGNKGVAADARGRPREHPQEQKGVILWECAMAILKYFGNGMRRIRDQAARIIRY